jgi:hypothetical protein
MKRIPFRWILPMFHLAMDAILVSILIVQANEPGYVGSTNNTMKPASYPQEVGSDPRFGVGIFEGVAMPFWFLLGWIADRGPAVTCRWCLALLLVRILAISAIASRYRDIGWRLQVLFWLGASIYAIASGI